MILYALAKTGGTRGHSIINTQRTTIIFIHLLPSTTLLPRGETLLRFPITTIQKIIKDFSPTTRKYSKTFHQQPENIQRLFIDNPKIFKDFSSKTRKFSKIFHRQPENIQRFFIDNPKIFKDFSSTTRYYSKTFHQQPENIQ